MTTASAPFAADAFRFDPITDAHLPMLRAWLLRPHVAQWWGPAESLAELHDDYVRDATLPNATRAYIAHHADRAIGFIQCYVALGSGEGWWEHETDPGVRGIDQFLAEAGDLGRGLGRAMIAAFVARLLDDPAVTAVQTDPAPHNERAIRCYRAAGFRDVGVVLTPDGEAMLMRVSR